MTRSVSRPLTLLLAFLLALAGTITWTANSDAAVQYPNASRIEGATNVQIAVNVSRETFPDGGVSSVVLARDNLFPDSLAATGFASVASAPILFTPTNSLAAATRDEIQRVMTSGRVYILGGPNAVSSTVEDQIEAMGYAVSRMRGSDRFQTAALVANAMVIDNPNLSQVIIVRGRGEPDATQGWVDAVACGAYAAERGLPILLVDPNGAPGSLPAQTRDFLKNRDFTTAHVCGGPGAVTQQHVAQLKELVPNVFRYSGPNRAQTAIAVAEGLWKVTDPKSRTFLLTPGFGDRYAYGIAASQLAAKLDAPVLLVDTNTPEGCLSGGNGQETLCWLQNGTGSAAGLIAIGSNSIVSDGVLAANAKAAGLRRDQNPPPRIEDLSGEDLPGDAGTGVRLVFSPVTDPEGAEIAYEVYFRVPPEPEPEPTASETPTEEPTASETPTEDPSPDPSGTASPSETATESEPEPDPVTIANGTRANRVTITEEVIDDVPTVTIDVQMCDRAIPVDEEGAPTSETPESTCKGIEYEFMVVARDAGGNVAEPSDTVAVAPVDDVPDAPAVAPTAEAASSGFTTIRWAMAPEADVAGYIVERASWSDGVGPIGITAGCNDDWAEIARVGADETSTLDDGTAVGTTYCYRYRIFDTTNNETGNSPELQEFTR